MEDVLRYIDDHSQNFIEDLVDLVNLPSISAKNEGIVECSRKVEQMLRKTGFHTRIIHEVGYPVIYAELRSKVSKKTLLFYDHYDVQPPEPLEDWKFAPFSGKIHEGRIYGRGVSDNKGNIVSRIKAVEAFLKTGGEVPVNIKFVIEGEEEIGSPYLSSVIHDNKELFDTDAIIWEFGGTNFEGRPEIFLGLKGVLSVELKVKGASRDVHSANAPLIPNPAWRLVWALNHLKNKDEEILINGFYENVKEPSEEEIKLLKDIPLEEEKIKEVLGLHHFLMKKSGFAAKKAFIFDPTCTINGQLTGYTGPGSKTVLPNEAMAKLDFRLVPDQMPDEICQKLKNYLKKSGFEDIDIKRYGSTEPTKTAVTNSFVNIVSKAARKSYNKEPVIYPISPGSGPMHLFHKFLKCPIVSAGCSHAEAKGHAPNENLIISGFITGTKFMTAIIDNFGKQY